MRTIRTVVLGVCAAIALNIGPWNSQAEPAASASVPAAGAAFPARLVAAARAQVDPAVVYAPEYVKIPYPNGDVPLSRGVCTDVVVRAYRALGLDLQVAIHHAQIGSGDANIDHRRVEVQRRFFAHFGQSLPVTLNTADYLAGDIVSYHLEGPFPTHIAIVSDRLAPSARPLVIHNRGQGVQEEDWLFAAKITGHYRYELQKQ